MTRPVSAAEDGFGMLDPIVQNNTRIGLRPAYGRRAKTRRGNPVRDAYPATGPLSSTPLPSGSVR